jgi:hypothetical protein
MLTSSYKIRTVFFMQIAQPYHRLAYFGSRQQPQDPQTEIGALKRLES